MDLSGMYEYFAPMVGTLAGDYFDILRPNYAQPDNTPVVIARSVRFRTDPVTGRFAEPRWMGVNYYDIFGPRSLLQPGDILVRSTPDGMTPPVTIVHFMNLKTTTGIRTARVGQIIESKLDPLPVYNPVYFDWLGQGFPGSNLNRALEDSLKVPSQRAVLFARPNVINDRMHLVETDLGVSVDQGDGTKVPYQRTWIIDEIDLSGNLMILTLRNE